MGRGAPRGRSLDGAGPRPGRSRGGARRGAEPGRRGRGAACGGGAGGPGRGEAPRTPPSPRTPRSRRAPGAGRTGLDRGGGAAATARARADPGAPARTRRPLPWASPRTWLRAAAGGGGGDAGSAGAGESRSPPAALPPQLLAGPRFAPQIPARRLAAVRSRGGARARCARPEVSGARSCGPRFLVVGNASRGGTAPSGGPDSGGARGTEGPGGAHGRGVCSGRQATPGALRTPNGPGREGGQIYKGVLKARRAPGAGWEGQMLCQGALRTPKGPGGGGRPNIQGVHRAPSGPGVHTGSGVVKAPRDPRAVGGCSGHQRGGVVGKQGQRHSGHQGAWGCE